MSENNLNSINKVIEAIFKDKEFNRIFNKSTSINHQEESQCNQTGNRRIFKGSISISYPDITIKKDKLLIHIQLKNLSAIYKTKDLVIIDQLKSHYGKEDDFRIITIYVINSRDVWRH